MDLRGIPLGGAGFLQQRAGRPFVKPKAYTAGRQQGTVGKAPAANAARARKLHGVPAVIGHKSKARIGQKQMVQLFLGGKRAGAADDPMPLAQGFLPQLFQHKAAYSAVFILQHYDLPARQRAHRVPQG